MRVRRPPTFLLTLRRLGVGCGQKWCKVVYAVDALGKRFQIEAAVEFNPETPKTRPEPDTTQIAAAFTSLVVVVAHKFASPTRGSGFSHKARERSRGSLRSLDAKSGRLGMTKNPHVSRQSPNSHRRKRTAQGPCRVQAGDRREIWAAILHHEFGRENCPGLSLRGMGADRAEAGGALNLQTC